MKDYNNSRLFKAKDNSTDEENELIHLHKENKQLLMENDILHQRRALAKQGMIASRRKIRQIMNKYRLVLNYTVKQYKVHKSKCNEEKIDNIVHRECNVRQDLDIVVSNVTYVNVSGK